MAEDSEDERRSYSSPRIDQEGSMTDTFTAPGAGSWEHDADHQAAPRGQLAVDLMDETVTAGFKSFFGRYGMPLDRLEARHVNGWMYMRAVPAGVPDKGGAPPPDWVISILSRVIPELRRRNKKARAAQAQKLWLRDAEEWIVERSDWEARLRAVAEVDPAMLSAGELGSHAEQVVQLASDTAFKHFALLGPAIGIGELLVAAADWGIDPQDVAVLLAGSSPASSATRPPLVALAEEVRNAASETVPSNMTVPSNIEELRGVSVHAATLVDNFILEYGWRALSDDVATPTLAENPDTLVGLVDGVMLDPAEVDVESSTEAIRASVPAEDRARFDELLADARACYEVLDDNSGLLSWAVGLTRRAALEVGTRLVDRAEVTDPNDVFLFSSDELVTAAGEVKAPADLDARRRSFERDAELEPPAFLGDEPQPPPDMSLFPEPLGRMGETMNAYLGPKFTVESGNMGGQLGIDGVAVATGEAIGQGSVLGRILVCEDASEAMDRLEPGDILVCSVTTPAWNSLFPMLGGIVTCFGGPLGHTAVMAREFGTPAVVGVREISTDWDQATGEITLAGRASDTS
jgi:phosphohistidine swiveling domain-containing protein